VPASLLSKGEMMKYKIDEKESGIDISVTDAKNDKQKLLDAFRECQEGRCSCPTEEYKKLASLEVAQDKAGIRLRLKSKDGEVIDKSEIEKCLGYTAERVKDKE
jgi:hypothetical protein